MEGGTLGGGDSRAEGGFGIEEGTKAMGRIGAAAEAVSGLQKGRVEKADLRGEPGLRPRRRRGNGKEREGEREGEGK